MTKHGIMRPSVATGTGSTLITFAAGTILPAGRHLLLGAKGGAYTGAVAADATFTAGLADSGSVWLFKGTPASLSKTDPLFVDLVGWGTAVAANYEGSGAAPSPSTAFKSVERTSPTADTDQNGADFVLRAARTPQNLASP